MGEASGWDRSWDSACGAQLPSTQGTPAHLIGDGLVVNEVSKGNSRRPRVILVVDAGAGGLLFLPPGDSQLVPASTGSRGARPRRRRAGQLRHRRPGMHRQTGAGCILSACLATRSAPGQGGKGLAWSSVVAAGSSLSTRGRAGDHSLLQHGQEQRTCPGTDAAARCPTRSLQPRLFLTPAASPRT